MLIETVYKPNDIISVRLQTGEEIIGRFVNQTDTVLSLQKPMTMVIQETPNGPVMGLGTYMVSGSLDASFNVQMSSVQTIAKTESDIAKQYTTSTTGLALP